MSVCAMFMTHFYVILIIFQPSRLLFSLVWLCYTMGCLHHVTEASSRHDIKSSPIIHLRTTKLFRNCQIECDIHNQLSHPLLDFLTRPDPRTIPFNGISSIPFIIKLFVNKIVEPTSNHELLSCEASQLVIYAEYSKPFCGACWVVGL